METDRSCCVLSMHQPWASLLVYGIKRIENRNWRTHYRGRLWIHATSRKPTPQETQQLEQLYNMVYEMEGYHDLTFPQTYPTGVLLGCVDVVDCLTAHEVETWQGLPESLKLEVGAAFCFLCENPQFLERPERMRGYPGLWYLPLATTTHAETLLQIPSLVQTPIHWNTF